MDSIHNRGRTNPNTSSSSSSSSSSSNISSPKDGRLLWTQMLKAIQRIMEDPDPRLPVFMEPIRASMCHSSNTLHQLITMEGIRAIMVLKGPRPSSHSSPILNRMRTIPIPGYNVHPGQGEPITFGKFSFFIFGFWIWLACGYVPGLALAEFFFLLFFSRRLL